MQAGCAELDADLARRGLGGPAAAVSDQGLVWVAADTGAGRRSSYRHRLGDRSWAVLWHAELDCRSDIEVGAERQDSP